MVIKSTLSAKLNFYSGNISFLASKEHEVRSQFSYSLFLTYVDTIRQSKFLTEKISVGCLQKLNDKFGYVVNLIKKSQSRERYFVLLLE